MPANATPDTVIDLDEQPVGASETHLFLLRVARDNLGQYEATRVEVFLVAQDWRSGAEEVWVIDRFVKSMDYSDGGDPLGYSIKRDEGQTVGNIHRIIADEGGMPWQAVQRTVNQRTRLNFASDSEAMRFSFGTDARFAVTRDALQGRLDQVTDFFAERMVDYRRHSTVPTRQYVSERGISAGDCRVDRVMDFWVPGRAELSPLVKFDCASSPDDPRTSVVVQLQPAPTPADP
ncbi:MAG: hypothetical protein SXU28_05190 [Pseudomonadota bacterium]|nr:hypothetical protein [Pseudomonadota bacterium]